MKSREHLVEFCAASGADAQRLIIILSLGMCRALEGRLVTGDYSCHRLFGPALISAARRADASKGLLDALLLATELDAIERLVADDLERSLADVQARLLEELRLLAPVGLEGSRWSV